MQGGEGMTNGIRSETNGDNLFEYRTEFDYSDMVRRISEQVRARLAELGYRKCSECKERQGYYLDAETIQRQQESIAELEGLVRAHESGMREAWAEYDKRDELIRDMYLQLLNAYDAKEMDGFAERMGKLEIEVKDEG